MTNRLRFDDAAIYLIKVGGRLDLRWSDWFDGFTITVQASGDTLLVGPVADQPALHGLLHKIRDLSLPLLSLERIEGGVDGSKESKGAE